MQPALKMPKTQTTSWFQMKPTSKKYEEDNPPPPPAIKSKHNKKGAGPGKQLADEDWSQKVKIQMEQHMQQGKQKMGKNRHKPYTSPSMEDMFHHMIRMARPGNGPSNGMTFPPPLEFYDFWLKSLTSEEKLHTDLLYEMDGIEEQHNLAVAQSDLSSSTKASEPQEVTPDSDDDDEDFEVLSDIENAQRTEGPLSSYAAGTGASKRQLGDRGSRQGTASSAVSSYQSLNTKHKKEMGAIAASILNLQLEEDRKVMEHALKDKGGDVIESFGSPELDDPFLMDSITDGLLLDSSCTPIFDFFNVDTINREREREKERLKAEKRNAKAEKEKSKKKSKKSDIMLRASGESEYLEDEERSIISATPIVAADCKTCLTSQKQKIIEENIRAAVRCRSAMGSYIVPEGQLPLAHTFAFKTPGPAAYYPKVNAVKPNPPTAFFIRRWNNSIYETPGPGPAGYAPTCNCTATMLNLHEGPRFLTSDSIGPGPGRYNTSKIGATAKEKPHALILSRRPLAQIGCGSAKLTNVYGVSRFGKANPPKALILSRHVPKDKLAPGPDYDPYAAKDTRLGIVLKGPYRGKDWEESPGFLDLPPLDTLPGKSFGIRKFETLHNDSPGPIYQLPPPTRKPVTMTFRPFPMPGREAEPSPIEYGTKPGEQCVKFRYPRAPTHVMCGSHDLNYGIGNTPGPDKYVIKDCTCKEKIKMKGKYPTKIDLLPGPADYEVGSSHLPKPPRAVFQHKKQRLLKNDSPGFKYDIPKHTVIGGLMAPRWPRKDEEDQGPDFYNLFGFTNRGKYSKIPLSLKSRMSPFVFSHLSENAEIPKRTGCGIELLDYNLKKPSQNQTKC